MAAALPQIDAPATRPWELYSQRQRRRFLAILFLVATSNYFDRNVLAVLLEPIKHEFHLSDTLLGVLGGFSFALFYALFGIPISRWGDGGNRRTIITVALVIWSLMTVVCGLAQSFVQLAAARVGVGVGEAGAIPPAQSLIADYFAPERRAGALAVFTSAATAGLLLGFGVGGYVAEKYGWRAAFILGGIPGLALALLTRWGLDEPRERLGFPEHNPRRESFGESMKRLRHKRSYVHALIGCQLYFFMAYGALLFIPAYLIRVQHIALATVSVAYGTVGAVGALIGTLGGGWLANRLGSKDVRWLAWLCAIACALTGPLNMLALGVNNFTLFLVLSGVGSTLLAGGLPSMFAGIIAVAGSARRTTALAIVLFSATLIGGGLGPLVSGALSDVLTATYGDAGLRYALLAVMPVLLVTGVFFYAFGRAMPADLEE